MLPAGAVNAGGLLVSLTAHGPLADTLPIKEVRTLGLRKSRLAPQAFAQAVELWRILRPGTGCGSGGGAA